MNHRRSRLWLVAVLALICLLAQPVAVWSQCVVTSTMVYTFGPTMVVFKTLSTPGLCQSTMNMNVLGCFPSAGSPQTTVLLGASANAPNPSCAFTCTCTAGTITIDNNDGLPVELMDFAVED